MNSPDWLFNIAFGVLTVIAGITFLILYGVLGGKKNDRDSKTK
jgi:ABC-type sulfate transport system permease subunit